MDIAGGVGQVRHQPLADHLHLVDQFVRLDRLGLEHRLQIGVFVGEISFELGGEGFEINQVREAQAGSRDLVFVRRSDSETGGADRILAQSRLAGAVDRAMIRHYQVGVVAELEAALAVQERMRMKVVEFLDQGDGIDYRAVADHADLARVQRAGRNQAQDELLSVDDQGMGRVVAPLETDDDIGVGRQQIDDLALTLIAPLCADYGHCFHCDTEPRCARRAAESVRTRPR